MGWSLILRQFCRQTVNVGGGLVERKGTRTRESKETEGQETR